MKRKPKIGRPLNSKRRAAVAKLVAAGKTQAEIARIEEVTEPTIARYRRALGIEAKTYLRPKAIRRGKRICAVCGQKKTLGAFKNDRSSTCTMCQRTRDTATRSNGHRCRISES